MYDRDDYLLIRDEKVIAVSANAELGDGDHPVEVKDTDAVVLVLCKGNEIAYLTRKVEG